MSGIQSRKFTKIVSASLIMLIVSFNAWSQVIVQRSNDKVVISGVTYYIHQVRKGETAYSISRAYGITVEELTKENPPAVYGLHEGQTLRIPYKPDAVAPAANSNSQVIKHDESKYIYHTLKPGETVYFLSKTYDVSENEIIKSNPGIDITKLSVGMEIAIPLKDFMSNRQRFESPEKQPVIMPEKEQIQVIPAPELQNKPQEKGYYLHKVQSGESLASIAEQYGLSLRELRRANRDLRFPQVGDYVKIPGVMPPEKIENIPIAADTVSNFEEALLIRPMRPTAYTPVQNLGGVLNVAVMLPFYLSENAARVKVDSSKLIRGRRTYKVTRMEDDWIYPRSLDFIEMYDGILLAADTLCSIGLNINLHAFDIKSDTIELTRIIKSGELERMDLIIGPVYSHNLSIVASYAKNLNIPVVSPVPLYDNSVLSDNPDLFLASASLEVAQQALAKRICEDPYNNFIFIHSDTSGTDEDVQRFKQLILADLSAKIPYDDIKFREFPFYSRSMFDNDSINRLSHALSEGSKNMIIIASEDPPVISETIIDIHSLSKRFDIQVFGYPVMRDLDNLDPSYYFDLDLMIFSPYWIDYSKNVVIQFNADFRKKFLTEPVEKSYAWQGYDLAYYFMSGLALHGKDFIRFPEIHRPLLLQTDYDFVNKSDGSGFENRNLYLVRYTKDYEIKLVDQ